MGCCIESAVGLRCLNALLLDLGSMLFTFRTVSDCVIVTNLAKRWLILFVTVMFLHFVSVKISRR